MNGENGSHEIADAIRSAGREIGKEGASGMGALEALGLVTKDGLADIASALTAIADALNRPAEATEARDRYRTNTPSVS